MKISELLVLDKFPGGLPGTMNLGFLGSEGYKNFRAALGTEKFPRESCWNVRNSSTAQLAQLSGHKTPLAFRSAQGPRAGAAPLEEAAPFPLEIKVFHLSHPAVSSEDYKYQLNCSK